MHVPSHAHTGCFGGPRGAAVAPTARTLRPGPGSPAVPAKRPTGKSCAAPGTFYGTRARDGEPDWRDDLASQPHGPRRRSRRQHGRRSGSREASRTAHRHASPRPHGTTIAGGPTRMSPSWLAFPSPWPGAAASFVPFAAAVVLGGCNQHEEPLHHRQLAEGVAIPTTVTVEARIPRLPTYPCSRCHGAPNREPDPRERAFVEFHTQKVLKHGTQGGWCYRCHTKNDIDKLHLQDGTLVTFDQAYEVCGSCHGDKFRDWKAGLHGLTTGFWNGAEVRRSCPNCHDPHSPAFAPMKPERMPARPRTEPATTHATASEGTHGERH